MTMRNTRLARPPMIAWHDPEYPDDWLAYRQGNKESLHGWGSTKQEAVAQLLKWERMGLDEESYPQCFWCDTLNLILFLCFWSAVLTCSPLLLWRWLT